MSKCCGGCVCRPGSISVLDTNCIDLSGNGLPTNPLMATPIIPPTVIHPLLLTPHANGLTCTPDGLEVQPDRQFALAFLPPIFGSVPPTVVNTAGGEVGGQAIWGAPNIGNSVGYDANRTTITKREEERPILTATLEPGATVTVGHKVNVFGFIDWHVENTTPVIQVYQIWLGHLLAVDSFIPPGVGNPGSLETWNMLIRTTGFTGASAVSTLGNVGIGVTYYGWAI